MERLNMTPRRHVRKITILHAREENVLLATIPWRVVALSHEKVKFEHMQRQRLHLTVLKPEVELKACEAESLIHRLARAALQDKILCLYVTIVSWSPTACESGPFSKLRRALLVP